MHACCCQAAGVSTSSNLGVIGGPADVAKLRICLDTLGDALGQPALRTMTQLIMAGGCACAPVRLCACDHPVSTARDHGNMSMQKHNSMQGQAASQHM